MAFPVSLQEAFVAFHCCPNGRCTLVYQIATYGDIRAQLGKLPKTHHLSPSNGQDQRLSTDCLMTGKNVPDNANNELRISADQSVLQRIMQI